MTAFNSLPVPACSLSRHYSTVSMSLVSSALATQWSLWLTVDNGMWGWWINTSWIGKVAVHLPFNDKLLPVFRWWRLALEASDNVKKNLFSVVIKENILNIIKIENIPNNYSLKKERLLESSFISFCFDLKCPKSKGLFVIFFKRLRTHEHFPQMESSILQEQSREVYTECVNCKVQE